MLKEKLFLEYLKFRARPSLIRRHLKKKRLQGGNNCETIDVQAIRAGAVQLKLALCSTPLDYVDQMCRWAAEAAAAGVQLLAFPENNSFQLLGLLPGIEKLAQGQGQQGQGLGTGLESGQGLEDGQRQGKGQVEGQGEHAEGPEAAFGPGPGSGPTPRLSDVFRFAGPVFNDIVHRTFPYLAREYGMYIMAGSFPYVRGEHVMNRSLLFGPRGEVLGGQDKVHLMPVEHAGGLTGGESFQIFKTPLGKLAAPVCMDATYFETFRILREAGADIVMVPIFNPEPYNFWLALRGIWPRVQESLVYGIKSAMVGEIMGYTLTGRAGIFAPLELTPGGDGVLAEIEDPHGEGLATANLDLEALWGLRENHPYLGDQNPALVKNYFPGIYDR